MAFKLQKKKDAENETRWEDIIKTLCQKFENVYKMDCENCQNLEKIEHLNGTIIFNKDQTVVTNLPCIWHRLQTVLQVNFTK